MTGYTLFAPKGHSSILLARIVARYAGVELTVSEPNKKDLENWLSQPLASINNALTIWPVLAVGDGSFLWGLNAIARYLARENSTLTGNNAYEVGVVDQWLNFVSNELSLPFFTWQVAADGKEEIASDLIDKVKQDAKSLLSTLDRALFTKTFLASERLSLADIAVAVALYEPFTKIVDASFRNPFKNLVRWFKTVVNQPLVAEILGEVKFNEKLLVVSKKTQAAQTKAPTQAKPAESAQKKPQAEQKGKAQEKKEGNNKKKDRKEKKEERGRGRQQPQEPQLNEFFGVLPMNQSKEEDRKGRTYTDIGDINDDLVGKSIWIKARVFVARGQGNICFLLLRQRFSTIQAVLAKGGDVTNQFVKFAQKLAKETIVIVEGAVTKPEKPVESATQKVELQIKKLFVESVSEVLPLLVEDAARPVRVIEQRAKEIEELEKAIENETDATKKAELTKKLGSLAKYVEVGPSTRLDNRIIDLRTPTSQAIFRIQSGVADLFRRYLLSKNFVEIHSPKMIGAASEGGANVFQLKYFHTNAYLAQSPQLYKQMAIIADFERVFEIAPVFRAENSNTPRHLTEFVGLDLEMAITEHYHEALDVLGELFIAIFEGLEKEYATELATVREQFPFPPFKFLRPTLRLTYPEGIKMLHDAGIEQDPLEDLSTPAEKALGRLVKEKYDTDFYILEKYPASARPFYTMPDPEDERYTNSYDFFIRGEEILSGSQRIHDAALLEKRAIEKGVGIPSIQSYIDAFKYGAPPHAGGGIGLERVVFLYLGLNDIRQSSLFPRDPYRLTP